MIDTRLYQQLVALADHGTLAAAAEYLNMSQASLSRAMKHLEEETNLTLFVRKNKKLTLTPTGELLVRHTRNLLVQEQNMLATVREYDRRTHTIAVGSCSHTILLQLRYAIRAIAGENTITNEVMPEDSIFRRMSDGSLQLGVVHLPTTNPELICFPIAKEQMYISLRSDHPLASRKDGVYLKELDGEVFLRLVEFGYRAVILQREMPHAHFIFEQRDTLDQIAIHSTLPFFTSDIRLAQNPEYGTLPFRVIIPVLDDDFSCTYYLVYSKEEKSRYSSLDSLNLEP